jgi:hypothetical protein
VRGGAGGRFQGFAELLLPFQVDLNDFISSSRSPAMSQVAACARCEKIDCSAVVLLPSLPDSRKKFDFNNNLLAITCPVCLQPFVISVREIAFENVTDSDLNAGYISM